MLYKMAALSCRALVWSCRRNIFTAARLGEKCVIRHASCVLRGDRSSQLIVEDGADPIEHATGLEKKQLLAHIAGDDDPFATNVLTRGPGTQDCPNQIPSAFGARIVGCVCDEDAMHIKWMWLHDGLPRRCACGHWFKLVYKAPLDSGH